MYKLKSNFSGVRVNHNFMCRLVLLFVVIGQFSGCTRPLPVVYFSNNQQITSQFGLKISRIEVFSDDFPDISTEIIAFIHQKMSKSLVNSSVLVEGSFLDMTLDCHIEGSSPVTFAEPLPEGAWISVRFDLSELSSPRITRSLRFEYRKDSGQPMTLQTCLGGWLDELNDVLPPKTDRHPYTLARGVSKQDRLGRELVERGDYQAALRLFQKAIDAYPNDHAALYNAGLMCEVLAQSQRALNFYQRAFRISSKQEYQVAVTRIENSLLLD